MQVSELLKNRIGSASHDVSSLLAKGLCCDTRTLKAGDVFFALAGVKDDGARYAEEAVQKGAVAIVHDRSQNFALNIPQIKVTNARETLALAASVFYNHPSRAFYLTGITGTNGKTTLTYLLEQLWQPQSVGVIGTVNTRFAGKASEASHTTPDVIQLNTIFSEMKKCGVQAVAIETSSHALDQHRVTGLDFDAAVFTNLTQDHLDYHNDMASYFEAKKKLFVERLSESSKKNKVAIINLDDDYGFKLVEAIQAQTTDVSVKTYSLRTAQADLFLKHADITFQGTRMELEVSGQKKILHTNLIGHHNVQNVMAALLVALHQGQSFESAAEKLKTVTVPGRLDRVGTRNVFVDYAHTPDALQNVITALQNVRKQSGAQNRLITVFGCGGDRDRTKRPLMGSIAAELSDVVLVTSDNPRTEDPEKIIADILPGVVKHQEKYNGRQGYLVEVDRAVALEKAAQLATPDDIILVAGKGHEDYQIIGTEKRHFDDKEILTKLLK